MSVNTLPTQQGKKVDLTAAIVRRFVQIVVGFVIQAGLFFIPAGRLDWPMAWAFFGLALVFVAINALVLLPKSPDLVAERAQDKKDAKTWDKWLTAIGSPLLMSVYVIAGLDVRFGWSTQVALPVQLAALALIVVGFFLVGWAMSTNKFFSRVVRIQKDRGHVTITGGPYRFVRHPGYAGMILWTLAMPVVFGSLWALVPAALGVAFYVVRAAFEDRTLQNELDGYKDYARQVRYRLVPGLW